VYGTANVRVCDASVIPILPREYFECCVCACGKGGGYFERRFRYVAYLVSLEKISRQRKGVGLHHVTSIPHPPLLLSSSLCRPLHTTNKTTHVYYPSLPQKTPISKIKQNKILTCLTLLQSHPQTSSQKSFVAHRTANDFPVEQWFW
jgi:hypothetical protein